MDNQRLRVPRSACPAQTIILDGPVIKQETEGPYQYTVRDAGAITLAGRDFRVSIQDNGDSEPMVWLTGPRGASYFLRPFLGPDKGMRQVISWKGGQPLRVKGNEVRVVMLGDIIEARYVR